MGNCQAETRSDAPEAGYLGNPKGWSDTMPKKAPGPKKPVGEKAKTAKWKRAVGYYDGLWYGASVVKEGPEGADVVWDDGTFTSGLGKDQVVKLKPGMVMEAKWGSEWFECTLLRVGKGVVVKWFDGTLSTGLAPDVLRPKPLAALPDYPTKPAPQPIPVPATPLIARSPPNKFGRRSVLTPGTPVDIRNRVGLWESGVVQRINGETCHVATPTGPSQVPLTDVRSASPDINFDL